MTNLSETEIHALNEALDDEDHAFATYEQVIADFGEAPPFSNIRDAEGRHIDTLCVLFESYGLVIPENSWPGKVQRYASLQQACEAGIAAEIANGEMYQLLLRATERTDIFTVFSNLQEASQQRHLPAFQRSAQGSATGRHGRGARRHRRGKGHA